MEANTATDVVAKDAVIATWPLQRSHNWDEVRLERRGVSSTTRDAPSQLRSVSTFTNWYNTETYGSLALLDTPSFQHSPNLTRWYFGRYI